MRVSIKKFGKVSLMSDSISMNSILVLIGILMFVASFAFSLGPVMWVLFSEIFPARIRGIALATFGLINSLTSSVIQLVFPWELVNLGNTLAYLSYAIFEIIGLMIIGVHLTKGGKSNKSNLYYVI